jgi:hypothetical protein
VELITDWTEACSHTELSHKMSEVSRGFGCEEVVKAARPALSHLRNCLVPVFKPTLRGP